MRTIKSVAAFVVCKTVLDDLARLFDEFFFVVPNPIRKVAVLPVLLRRAFDLFWTTYTKFDFEAAGKTGLGLTHHSVYPRASGVRALG